MELCLQDHGTYEAFVVCSLNFLHRIFILLSILTLFSANVVPLKLTMLDFLSSFILQISVHLD